jgi:hypothetical protein
MALWFDLLPTEKRPAAVRYLVDDVKSRNTHLSTGFVGTSVLMPTLSATGNTPLAYKLLSEPQDPEVASILDNVILVLWPTLNPDGQDIVANWYRENVGTPYEVSPLHELYQKYIGHDNNRDAYMLNVPESRCTRSQLEPQIIHVHHQSSPFPTRIWLPPFMGRSPTVCTR